MNNQNLVFIPEVTSQKYAEISGISHYTVKKYCRIGKLTCRKVNNEGVEIKDYKANPKGTWLVDTVKRVGE